mmetsp:Transcript_107907/g.315489  ORF Transcript_107907/g.315489 Transcript_107907/m.315489 type:complete len:203 (-) Transcript_107907:363-971(-)
MSSMSMTEKGSSICTAMSSMPSRPKARPTTAGTVAKPRMGTKPMGSNASQEKSTREVCLVYFIGTGCLWIRSHRATLMTTSERFCCTCEARPSSSNARPCKASTAAVSSAITALGGWPAALARATASSLKPTERKQAGKSSMSRGRRRHFTASATARREVQHLSTAAARAGNGCSPSARHRAESRRRPLMVARCWWARRKRL